MRVLLILALLVVPLHAARAGDALTRTSNERAVKVEVTPLNLSQPGATLDFRIVLDTHAGELDYDFTKIAVLRDDRGNAYPPVRWEGSKGGHHVQGTLRFAQAPRILEPLPAYLELQIAGVAGVPLRSFRWSAEVLKR